MKVEGPIYLIKGLRPGEAKPRSLAKKARDPERNPAVNTSADIITLVSRENRRALLPDLKSIGQARDLVADLINRLQTDGHEQFSDVHRLDPTFKTLIF